MSPRTVKPFMVPAVIGALILAASFIVFFQLSQYRDEIRQSNKDEYIKAIENTISRREGRVNTIASAVIAFYKNSDNVTEREFERFTGMVLGSNSEILNIFVLDNNTIVRSYPMTQYVGSDFDDAFPEYPTQIGKTKAMTSRFELDSDSYVIVAVPFNYFVPDEVIPGDRYKFVLLSPVDDNARLYEVDKSGALMDNTVQFTEREVAESVTITRQTNLFGHKLGKEYNLQYVLWDSSFEDNSYEQHAMLYAGIAMSVVIPLLLVRTNVLKHQLQAKSETLEKVNRELKEVETSKDEFVTMIVHDLKNPLLPIKAYSEILLTEKFGSLNEAQAQRIKSIKASAETLQKMFRDLLDASKLELGKLRLDMQPCGLADIVRNAALELEPEFRKKGVAVTQSLEDVLCRCDPMRMGQVLGNILLNALDFVPEGTGRIDITLKPDAQGAFISVRDNGAGIPKEKIDGLFSKFYQVHQDKNRRYGGSGLGLSVCKGIVEGHGGRIWAESGGEGAGTAINIVLPLGAGQAPDGQA